MADALEVRPATSIDLEAARGLVRDAGLPLDGFDEAASVFVAERDGAILGVAALEDHTDQNGRALLLRSVAVRPDRRGDGIGAALVHAALRAAEHVDVSVSLLTETAADYFPRFGFEPTTRDGLPSSLGASEELQGACAVTAHALIRRRREVAAG